MQNAVKSIALVLISVSMTTPSASAGTPEQQQDKAAISLSNPRRDGQLDCAPDAGSIFRCAVAGGVAGLSQSQKLLLWVRPVRPPSESEGWYLQRRPNGVANQSGNSWNGKIQIGNRDFPPQDGDIVDIAVSITEGVAADKLMRATGVVIEPEPVGVSIAKADNVRLRISKGR